jgi:hypothetical protein
MPTDCPHLSPTTPVLTCLPAPGHFRLRPQLLTRLSACPRARRSWRPPALFCRVCSPRDDERLRAGAVARTVPHSPYQGSSA